MVAPGYGLLLIPKRHAGNGLVFTCVCIADYNPAKEEILQGPNETNNNEQRSSPDKMNVTAVEQDESAGADNTSLVSADVMQLLDALLERIDEVD